MISGFDMPSWVRHTRNMTDAVNHKLPGDVASTADRERNGTHQVGDDVGGGVAITMALHGPERTETITAGDHRRLHAGPAHLAQPHRGAESIAQTHSIDRRGGIATLGDVIGDGLGGAAVANAAARLDVCLAQVAQIA